MAKKNEGTVTEERLYQIYQAMVNQSDVVGDAEIWKSTENGKTKLTVMRNGKPTEVVAVIEGPASPPKGTKIKMASPQKEAISPSS